MPKPSRPELFCAALYTLTGGKLKGLMVATIADRLGIPFEAVEEVTHKDAMWSDEGSIAHWLHETVIRLYLRLREAARRAASAGRGMNWTRPIRCSYS